MMKRFALAALLCLGSETAFAQSMPDWISVINHPGVGKIVTTDQQKAEFGLKFDVTNGVATGSTLNAAILNTAQIQSGTTPTQPLGDNSQNLANTNYVDLSIANALNQAQKNAITADTVSCSQIAVSGSQTLNFAGYGDSCYNLTLASANPSIVIGPNNPGLYQRIHVAVSEPASTSLAWSAPTSTNNTVLTDPAFAATSTPGSIQAFDIMTFGDNNVFVSAGKTYSAGAAQAYASTMTVDTPVQTTPGTAITLTGVETGGLSTSIDVSTDNFATSTTIPALAFAGSNYSLQMAGLAAGNYTIYVRDHNNPSALASTGTVAVNAWTPQTLTTSPGAYAVYYTQPGSSSYAQTASDGSLLRLASALNGGQYMIPAEGATGSKVYVASGKGADGKRRLIQFHPAATNAGAGDPAANWLTCGNLQTSGGYCGSGLLSLANSANNATSGNYTTIIGMDFDTNPADKVAYISGYIWLTLAVPGPLSFVQNRWNSGPNDFEIQIADAAGGFTKAVTQATNGYHVITAIKSGNQLTYRQDGQPIATSTITATGTTNFSGTYGDFAIGGSANAGQNAENGVPAPFVGDFQAYSGTLAGTDLANAEKMVGNSLGLSLTPDDPDNYADRDLNHGSDHRRDHGQYANYRCLYLSGVAAGSLLRRGQRGHANAGFGHAIWRRWQLYDQRWRRGGYSHGHRMRR